MRCPFCGSAQSSVIDKRTVKSSDEIRRRRECLKCQKRYTTYERVGELIRFVIKRDGRKQLYSRDKLKAGIEKALEKRPLADQLEFIVNKIEEQVFVEGEKEIESKQIGQVVLLELKAIDPIAYLRFASVCNKFSDTADFKKELDQLAK